MSKAAKFLKVNYIELMMMLDSFKKNKQQDALCTELWLQIAKEETTIDEHSANITVEDFIKAYIVKKQE